MKTWAKSWRPHTAEPLSESLQKTVKEIVERYKG